MENGFPGFIKNIISPSGQHDSATLDTIFGPLLEDFSPIRTASIFSALSLNPDYQSNQFRLDKAVNLCLSFCKGRKEPNRKIIQEVFARMSDCGLASMEDPAEDVFASRLWLDDKSYCVPLGLSEAGIYQGQLLLNVLEIMPRSKKYLGLFETVKLTLEVTDSIVKKNKIQINKIGGAYPLKEIYDKDLAMILELQNCVRLKGIERASILPSICSSEFDGLCNQDFSNTVLGAKPFFVESDEVILLLPAAITTTITMLIIEFFQVNGFGNELELALAEAQAKKIHQTKIFCEYDKIPINLMKIHNIEGWRVSEALIEFDKGYWFHFIFLMDCLHNIRDEWFSGFIKNSEDVSNYLDAAVNKAKSHIIDQNDEARGCSIIVLCGFGRGIAIGSRYKSDDIWRYEAIHSHDLDVISNDIDCTPHRIWRIIESVSKIEKMGAELFNINGFINLYGFAKNNDYNLIPQELFQDENTDVTQIHIALPTNCQAGLREKVYNEVDMREACHPQIGNVIVRRALAASFFGAKESNNIYCQQSISKELFRVVFINDNCELWIEQDVKKGTDFSLQYQLFEAAFSWISKIVLVAESRGIKLPENLKIWKLAFKYTEKLETSQDDINRQAVLESGSNKFSDVMLESSFKVDLIEGLSLEENISEQAIVLAMLKHICSRNINLNAYTLLSEVIENTSAKHIHIFKANYYREHFDLDRVEPIYIEQTDEKNIKLGLGWSCRKREKGNVIEGKEECKKYFQDLVGSIWNILKEKLEKLNRRSLIEKLLVNVEQCEYQKQRWKRTFKANLSLQSDRKNVYVVVTEKLRELNAASLSSRIVIEMAICECPVEGGRNVGILDIQELICLASLMHHLGGVSEAINYDAIPPKTIISAFGDILNDRSFNDTIISSYGFNFQRKELETSIKEYSKEFTINKPAKSVHSQFDEQFLNAWLDEFGFSIDEARAFVGLLGDFGLKKKELVYTICYNDLLRLFPSERKDVYERILSSFLLFPRDSWVKIPKPFKPTDWQPWRFRRRFSLVLRPIVQVDNDDERLLIISPQSVSSAFILLLSYCYEAYLDEDHFTSKLMKIWIGKKRAESGIQFNSLVAKKLSEYGWKVREEIKLTEVLNKKMDDYGDIDVLAWNNDKNTVLAVECKKLEFAKTQGEVARQLSEFRGVKNAKGKKDRLYKHLVRLQELEADIESLAKFTSIDKSLNLKAYVVFSNIVPMTFNEERRHKDKIDFITFQQLDSLS
jgi:hypothetical protein